jgi:hypothetical protein
MRVSCLRENLSPAAVLILEINWYCTAIRAQGTRATSQENIVHVTIQGDFCDTAMLAACFQLFDGLGCLPKGHAFIEGGMGIRVYTSR